MKLDISVVQHSADVQLALHADGRCYKLAQLGPDFVILDQPQQIFAQEAEIVMCVDGHESRWPVRLAEGASPSSHVTRIVARTR